jgi:hypothetical protein
LVADDALGRQQAVLFCVMPKVRQAGMPANHQHLRDPVQRIADMAEKLMLGADFAAVLAGELQMFMDFMFLYMLHAELQYLSGLVIDKDDGVKEAHEESVSSGRVPVCAAAYRGDKRDLAVMLHMRSY